MASRQRCGWNGTVLACAVLCVAAVGRAGAGDIIPQERRIAWNPGIPGGIPARTSIFCNVTVEIPGSEKVAYGDGVHDDSSAIQAAIELCPEDEVVYLPAGTYRLENRIYVKQRGNFVIRGDGPEQTVIHAALTNKSSAAITISGGSSYELSKRVMSIVSGCDRGSTNITVDSVEGSQIHSNACLLINQSNDWTFVTSDGTTQSGRCLFADRDGNGTRNLQQMVRITAIDGNNIAFEPALYWTYTNTLHPEAAVLHRVARHVGLEDFKIVSLTSVAHNHIELNSADQCWVSNIESGYARGRHIAMGFTLDCVIRDSYFHHGFGGLYTVGAGYGVIPAMSTDLLIENCIFDHLWGSVFVGGGSCGGVTAYNLVTNSYSANDALSSGYNANHGAHPMMSLWEGNIGPVTQADFHWGSSSHLTFFRNQFTGQDAGKSRNLRVLVLDKCSVSNNVVGNVLGNTDVTNWVYEMTEEGHSWATPVIYRLGYPICGNNRYNPEPGTLTSHDPNGSGMRP